MQKRILYGIVPLLALVILSLIVVPGFAHESWHYGAAMPTHREGYGAAVVNYLRTIYYIGGYDPWIGDTNIVEAYNVTTDTWTTGLATDPGGPRSELAAVSDGTHVFAVGGRSRTLWAVLNTLTMYDPVADAWTVLAPMPIATATEYCAAYHGGAIYVAGGRISMTPPLPGSTWTVNPALNSLQMYDIATDTWTMLAPIPVPWGIGDGALVAKGNKLFLVGGWEALWTGVSFVPIWLDTVWEYDIDKDTWTLAAGGGSGKTGLSTPRADIAAAVSGNRLYAIGGYFNFAMHSTVDVFQITGGGIKYARPGPALLSPTSEAQGVFTGGRIFVAGGGYLGGAVVPAGAMQILTMQQG